MQSLLAEQISTGPDLSKLNDILKNGQMGLALAILIVGAGLFTVALTKPTLGETFAKSLKFFGWIMLALFAVSFTGEMADKVMAFNLKRNPPDQIVRAIVTIPPLNNSNYKVYGAIQIHVTDLSGSTADYAANEPRPIEVRNGVQLYIDLENLTSKVKAAEALTQTVLASKILTTDPTAAGQPQ
jgi:hypothetical protein